MKETKINIKDALKDLYKGDKSSIIIDKLEFLELLSKNLDKFPIDLKSIFPAWYNNVKKLYSQHYYIKEMQLTNREMVFIGKMIDRTMNWSMTDQGHEFWSKQKAKFNKLQVFRVINLNNICMPDE